MDELQRYRYVPTIKVNTKYDLQIEYPKWNNSNKPEIKTYRLGRLPNGKIGVYAATANVGVHLIHEEDLARHPVLLHGHGAIRHLTHKENLPLGQQLGGLAWSVRWYFN